MNIKLTYPDESNGEFLSKSICFHFVRPCANSSAIRNLQFHRNNKFGLKYQEIEVLDYSR
jgi:hypothetical protein